MRAAVNVFAPMCAAIALQVALLVVPSFAAADDSSQSEGSDRSEGSGQLGAERWVPSLAVITGVGVQDWDGSVISRRSCPTCTPDAIDSFLRPPDKGNDRDVTPLVGGAIEFMTPELPLPLNPRLFIGGELSVAFGFERTLAGEGNPDVPRSPVPEGTDPQSINVRAEDILGQGSEVSAEMDNLVYGAHAGVAIPLELFGRQLRIKPSFAWIRYQVDLSGVLVDVKCINPGIFRDTFECNQPNSVQRDTFLSIDTDEEYDGIGPGLDIEMDTGRWGPLGSSLFFGGRVYHILGDREVVWTNRRTARDEITDFEPDTSSVRYAFEVDEWIYRVGIGLRVQWVGWEGWEGWD